MKYRFIPGTLRRWITRPGTVRRSAYNQFMRHLGHDLRNPINSILLMAQLLEESGSSPEATRISQRIQRQCHELSSIVDRAVQSLPE
jgi:signal transduction histidine kinase